MSITLYDANKYQPDICKSLTTAWLGQMMRGTNYGELWCAAAHAATENDAFYQSHLQQQSQLECKDQVKAQKNIQMLLTKTSFGQDYAHEAMALVMARTAPLDSLASQKTKKIMLMRVRNMKVVRSTDKIDLTGLGAEFDKLSSTARYYLISVRADSGSHSIAVVSTKAEGLFSPKGYLYYYDPNANKVARWSSRADMKGFLNKALLKDYRSINGIWQVQAM